jgi:hypothetical protein
VAACLAGNISRFWLCISQDPELRDIFTLVLRQLLYNLFMFFFQPLLQFSDGATSLMMKSKYGQEYHCSYIDRRHEEQREMEEERVAMETGIPDLLKPMEDRPCLIHV